MALTKTTPAADTPKTTTPTPAAAGTFESMDETNSTTPAAANDASVAAAPAPAESAAETLPATQQGGTLATSNRAEASAFQKEVEAMKGAADFRYGNFKVFKGNNGEIMETGGAKLGRWVKVTMLAWDDHYEVSPGSKSEKSKDAVGYSKDGVTMDSIIGSAYAEHVGTKMLDYVKFLQTDGDYPDAKSGRFIDIACIVHEADSEDAFNGEVIQVTLSQSSIPSFASYQEQLVMKAKAAARGIPVKLPADPFTFYFLRDVTTKGDNTWTKLKVLTTLPAKL